MIDQLDALRALDETGTTARAAARLRVTQSAISKRIDALEARVGRPLTERAGRNVHLTPEGKRMLEEVFPLLVALEERLKAAAATHTSTIRVAAAESMLASWLPAVLRNAAASAGVALEIHAHRGTNVMNRLRAGEVDVAITAEGDGDSTLVVERLAKESFVLVGAVPERGPIAVVTIESASLTGAWLDRQWARRRGGLLARIVISRRIESFSAALGLARGGFETALVPAGLAAAGEGVRVEGLARPVVISSRPSVRERAAVAAFVEALASAPGMPGRHVTFPPSHTGSRP